MKFVWDKKKADENVKNHDGVAFDEAQEVFDDAEAVGVYDLDHSMYEDRYKIVGLSTRRLLTVIYTEPEADVIKIISAWKSSKVEQKFYEEN